MTTHGFCERLAAEFPSLFTILGEHIRDYDEILPNVFLADVTRHLLSHGTHREGIVRFLDDSFDSLGPDVQELIAVSFVENIESEQDLERLLEGVDAPQLRSEWHRQRAT